MDDQGSRAPGPRPAHGGAGAQASRRERGRSRDHGHRASHGGRDRRARVPSSPARVRRGGDKRLPRPYAILFKSATESSDARAERGAGSLSRDEGASERPRAGPTGGGRGSVVAGVLTCPPRRPVSPPERALEHRREAVREQDRERQRQGQRGDERRHALRQPARDDLLVHEHHDRAVGQVEAVRGRSEAADGPRLEQAKQPRRAAGRKCGQQAGDGGPEGEIDPEQAVERPDRALPARSSAPRARQRRVRARATATPARAPARRRFQRRRCRRRTARRGRAAYWITNVSRRATCGPAIPTAVTTRVTAATMATAPQRRIRSRSSGNSTYSCASTAIDQNDRSGLGARTTFCSSRPLTTTDLRPERSVPAAERPARPPSG